MLQSPPTTGQTETEKQIRFYSPVMWQTDLLQQLDSSRALSRVATALRDGFIDTGWNAEQGLPIETPSGLQSAPDLSPVISEKKKPIMWFSRRCRHGYKKVRGYFTNKVCYYAAIRSVQFYRRDFQVEVDEPVYIETLEDDMHTELNEFVQADWRYVVVS